MMPYAVGLAHAELGLHTPGSDPEHQQHLADALGIFTQLGATADLARVQGNERVGA